MRSRTSSFSRARARIRVSTRPDSPRGVRVRQDAFPEPLVRRRRPGSVASSSIGRPKMCARHRGLGATPLEGMHDLRGGFPRGLRTVPPWSQRPTPGSTVAALRPPVDPSEPGETGRTVGGGELAHLATRRIRCSELVGPRSEGLTPVLGFEPRSETPQASRISSVAEGGSSPLRSYPTRARCRSLPPRRRRQRRGLLNPQGGASRVRVAGWARRGRGGGAPVCAPRQLPRAPPKLDRWALPPSGMGEGELPWSPAPPRPQSAL